MRYRSIVLHHCHDKHIYSNVSLFSTGRLLGFWFSLNSVIVPRSDLQVCQHGTAAGNMGIILKQFAQLGIKNWNELAEAKQLLGNKHMSPPILYQKRTSHEIPG